MKRKKRLLLILVVIVLAAGCAGEGKYLPRHAMQKPEEAVSMPHPIELEKAGVKTITVFSALMDPGLLCEEMLGVWPALARDSQGQMFRGYAFLATVNYWGDLMLQVVMPYSQAELADAKILYFNRDAGFAYRLDGQEIQPPEGEQKSLAYDPEKFDDEKYRAELFNQRGMTLTELDEFWRGYLGEKGQTFSEVSCVQEFVIGSPEWNSYLAAVNEQVAAGKLYAYKMGNGEIRYGSMPLENFSRAAVEMPGFTGPERFLKNAKLPLFALPFTGIGLLASAGVSIASNAAVAGVDDDWSGYYARAKILRHNLAPIFRRVVAIYKRLLAERDAKMKDLRFQLLLQKTAAETAAESQIGRRR